MYRKRAKGWTKHLDFILLDLLCLQAAFVLAWWLRMGFGNPYAELLYRRMAVCIEVVDLAVLVLYSTMKNVLKRTFWEELKKTIKHTVLIFFGALLYLFAMQMGDGYSRYVMFLMIAVYFVLSFAVRILWKAHLKSRRTKRRKTGGSGSRSLLVVTTQAQAADVIENLRTEDYSSRYIVGLALLDADLTGQEIAGIPVVAAADNVAAWVCREWTDEVLLVATPDRPVPEPVLKQLTATGVVIHLNLVHTDGGVGRKQMVEKVGTYTVLTTSMNYMTTPQCVAKRAMDILGGLAGSFLTCLIFLYVAPKIKKESPGPVFFKQERVGRNGKTFKIYKFRSMYLDAEERKAALLEQNRVKDGMMFKLDFDPRVIGNEILPDGTKKTGIGDFIRRTSLDEFPQFFNVLKGDMSLVGTRPPTMDEWEKYELHHRARLAIKPGITGMWQANGRSDISDFEEVVRLDTQYINEWSFGLDIKLLLKTVKNVIGGKGAM